MLLSAVSVLVVAQLSSEFLEGLINYPMQQKEECCPYFVVTLVATTQKLQDFSSNKNLPIAVLLSRVFD